MNTDKATAKYGTAEARWAGIGPYYGMFPTELTDKVVAEYTRPGDTVIDPFAGRGAAVFSAAIADRPAVGIDLNPLAYVYSNAKLKPCSRADVTGRLEGIAESSDLYREEAEKLPEFFHHCYSAQVRRFLLACRADLKWKRSKTDRVLMALVLISMHGKKGSALSNQIRQSTAMSPDYCVRWWREKQATPPEIDPVAFLQKRIEWRYVHDAPKTGKSAVYFGDCLRCLPRLAREVDEGKRDKARLLITSPPYHNVTNYYYDQWLRLWLLGGPEHPNSNVSNQYGGKFSNESQYRQLLNMAFAKCKPLLSDDAVIYVRTDKRESTYRNTRTALESNFPEKAIEEIMRPMPTKSQTKAYSRGGSPKNANCEIDIVLTPQ